jgi:hypothetical protein
MLYNVYITILFTSTIPHCLIWAIVVFSKFLARRGAYPHQDIFFLKSVAYTQNQNKTPSNAFPNRQNTPICTFKKKNSSTPRPRTLHIAILAQALTLPDFLHLKQRRE